jgi:CDGSH-type Zn-finger protein
MQVASRLRVSRGVPAPPTGQGSGVPPSAPAEPPEDSFRAESDLPPGLPDDVRAALEESPEPRDGRSGATITPYRDGPLIVRGDFRLVDEDGAEFDAGRSTIALCRCGKSGIKPFCDGTHKRAGFSAPSAPRRPRPAARLRRDAP